jgi:plasmid stability protein
MGQLVVRNLEDGVKDSIQRRAKRHGRSMEEEVRHILSNAAREDHGGPRKLGTRIAARFRRVGLSSELPEFHGEAPRPARFDR